MKRYRAVFSFAILVKAITSGDFKAPNGQHSDSTRQIQLFCDDRWAGGGRDNFGERHSHSLSHYTFSVCLPTRHWPSLRRCPRPHSPPSPIGHLQCSESYPTYPSHSLIHMICNCEVTGECCIGRCELSFNALVTGCRFLVPNIRF